MWLPLSKFCGMHQPSTLTQSKLRVETFQNLTEGPGIHPQASLPPITYIHLLILVPIFYKVVFCLFFF